MNGDNPYESTRNASRLSTGRPSLSRKFATVALGIGFLFHAFDVTGFGLTNSLPPRGGANGRLPCHFAMGMGMVVSIDRLEFRDQRCVRTNKSNSPVGILTQFGVVDLLAILGRMIFVATRIETT